MDLIILLGKYKNLLQFNVLAFAIILFFSSNLNANEKFEFNVGDKINILSDKAFRKTSTNEFEGVGNVVITHLSSTIYGEKATLNFVTGEASVLGNVRYINPTATLFGTKLKYNFISKVLDLENAKILSDNYVITGKRIHKENSNLVKAYDAEYSTCKDCPESWSIVGKEVDVDLGNYIKIKNAFLKINGVIAMYIPYIIFPIKQKRESGILFPSMGMNSKTGFKFQLPYFLAIDEWKDATFTPSLFGIRGLGSEIQYRQNLSEKTWFELNSLFLNDKTFNKNNLKNENPGKTFRHFSDLEFHFLQETNFNGHFYYNFSKDLDMVQDFDFFTNDKIRGTEIGGGGFLEFRTPLTSFLAESYLNRNLLFKETLKNDKNYVQILPKLTFDTIPFLIFQNEYAFLNKMTVNFHTDYTLFKSINDVNNSYIRNAQRLNFVPSLNLSIGKFKNIQLNHKLIFDYQNYKFKNEQNNFFSKSGILYETEATLEFEKIFGLAYVDKIPIRADFEDEKFEKKNLIGSLPEILSNKNDSFKLINQDSYRHSEIFKLKHYYFSNQKISGSEKFGSQIASEAGQFDFTDAIRSNEFISNFNSANDSLPKKNTIEFQWNNRLIKKSAKDFNPFSDGRYLIDNFDYTNVAHFDLSQGVDQSSQSIYLKDKLTRLYINTGFSIGKFNLGFEDYYLHQNSKHKTITSFSFNHQNFNIVESFTYNGNNIPVVKILNHQLSVNINDLINVGHSMDYNLNDKKISKNAYSLGYRPKNKCWSVDFNYSSDLIEDKIGFVFNINYNENNNLTLNVRK